MAGGVSGCGPASTTAAGLARRITAAQWKGVERGVAVVTGRMLDLLPAALAGGPVTIDLDTTDVEVSADLPVMPRAVRLCCSVG